MVSAPGGVGNVFAAQRQEQIRFRPDPGEPAVRLAAPPQQTALLVSAQEQRNETRLRSRAILEGNDVVFSNRTFTLGLGPNSPVYNAGLTTVKFREDPNGVLPDRTFVLESNRDEEPSGPLDIGEAEEEGDEGETGGLETLGEAREEDEEELRREELDLRNEDRRLERNLEIAMREREQALRSGDTLRAREEDRRAAQLEREQRELEEERRENELKRFEARLEETNQAAAEAILDNLGAAAGILGVLFGLPAEEEGDENQRNAA